MERVGFLFTGGDVAHAHAHAVPIHQKGDITSGRYILTPEGVEFASDQPRVSRSTLLEVREELGPVRLSTITPQGE